MKKVVIMMVITQEGLDALSKSKDFSGEDISAELKAMFEDSFSNEIRWGYISSHDVTVEDSK